MPTWYGPTWVTAQELADIKTDLASAVDSTNLGAASIKYLRQSISAGSAGYDPKTGAITAAHTSATISCLAGVPTEADAKAMGVAYNTDDRKFLIDRADLAADPQSEDLIVYAGVTYEVYKAKIHEATGAILVLAKVRGGK